MEDNIDSIMWDFVEKFYPNYYSSDEILNNNLLLVKIEQGDTVDKKLYRIQTIQIYFEALENALKDPKNIDESLSFLKLLKNYV